MIFKTLPTLFKSSITGSSRFFCTTTYFTDTHEWIKFNKSTMTAELGITDHAQNELGDLVHLEVVDSNT